MGVIAGAGIGWWAFRRKFAGDDDNSQDSVLGDRVQDQDTCTHKTATLPTDALVFNSLIGAAAAVGTFVAVRAFCRWF